MQGAIFPIISMKAPQFYPRCVSISYPRKQNAFEDIATELLIEKIRFATLMFRAATLQQKANFNPSQPRIPAGHPQGGQWTNSVWSRDSEGRAYKINEEFGEYFVDLRAIEGYRGAHTIREHVGKTRAELLVGMGPEASRWAFLSGAKRRNGSCGSYPEALRYVNETIADNIHTVIAVSSGVYGSEPKLLTKRYGHRTGGEWYRTTAHRAFM